MDEDGITLPQLREGRLKSEVKCDLQLVGPRPGAFASRPCLI